MSALSDRGILRALADGAIGIKPFTPKNLQPASYDLTLGPTYRRMNDMTRAINPQIKFDLPLHEFPPANRPLLVCPRDFLLAVTAERLAIDTSHLGHLDGKSSLARTGLLIHVTGGLVDPGWDGHLTLEICNVGPVPVAIWTGMLIAQIWYEKLEEPASAGYGDIKFASRYQGDSTPEGPRMWIDFVRAEHLPYGVKATAENIAVNPEGVPWWTERSS